MCGRRVRDGIRWTLDGQGASVWQSSSLKHWPLVPKQSPQMGRDSESSDNKVTATQVQPPPHRHISTNRDPLLDHMAILKH